MSAKLLNLKEMAMKLHERYQAGLLSVEEYLHFMTPIDEAIDKLEMQVFICHPEEPLERRSIKVKS